MNVEITALADANLEEIYLRIRKDSPARAAQKGLLKAAQTLDLFPERCPLAPESGPELEIIFVSLFGVKGAKLFEAEYWGEFDRDEMLLPDILLTDFATEVTLVSRPTLDTLWQAGGFGGCSHYDAAGIWIGDRR